MRLCCYFNYAPLYRQAIFKAIDDEFDTQFLFGREVENTSNSGIVKLDYSIFKKTPVEFENRSILGRYLWRTKLLAQLFKRYDTYIITADLSFSYIPFLLGCKLLRKRVFGWGHGPKDKNGRLGAFYCWFLKNLTGFLAYGEAGKKRMEELGIPGSKIHVIYNSLTGKVHDHPELKSGIYTSHFGNDDPTLFFIGRLTPVKQIDRIIETLVSHRAKGLYYNLTIIGDGPEREKLQSLIQRHNLSDRVWMYGACHDDAVLAPLLYNADLCVSPGNVGLTALSALQYGTPVVSHDSFEHQMPEYEVIMPNKTGMLYKYNDFSDMADKIEEWLTARHERQDIRENCYAVINGHWNADCQIELLKDILE